MAWTHTQKEAWARFIDERGAAFEPATFFRGPMLEVEHGPFVLNLVSWAEEKRHLGQPLAPRDETDLFCTPGRTRIRVAVRNPGGFSCLVSPEDGFDQLRKLAGRRELQVGDRAFDGVFSLESNDDGVLLNLLDDALRARILRFARNGFVGKHTGLMAFAVRHARVGQRLPDGVDALLVECASSLWMYEELTHLFGVAEALLDGLVDQGVVPLEDPGVVWSWPWFGGGR